MGAIETFREFVREKKLRNTPEREVIIQEVFANHDHFDADDLFLRLRSKKKRVSKASIYRTIPLLVESGLIKEVFFEGGHLHYEHIYGHKHHCHLRCICCGMILEFVEDEVFEIQNKIGVKNGFEATGHRLEIFGYCPQCIQKGEKVCRPFGRSRTDRTDETIHEPEDSGRVEIIPNHRTLDILD